RHFGDNGVEGNVEKKQALPEDEQGHCISQMHSRKGKNDIEELNYLHSHERDSAAKRITTAAHNIVNCLIQVNVSDESSKYHLQPNQVEDCLETLSQYKYVKLIGLMTMAPHTDDESVIEDTFKGLALLRDQVKEKYPTVTELSMGMSNDYQNALNYGATYIRVGSKIMGS